MVMKRDCQVGACSSVVEPGKLMCRRHWARVPKELQDEVYRTWKEWSRNFGNGVNLNAYRAAADAAVEAVS